ncbi:MAG: hypothetical protein AAFO73_02390 [Pseudomonadota bacterium]
MGTVPAFRDHIFGKAALKNVALRDGRVRLFLLAKTGVPAVA